MQIEFKSRPEAFSLRSCKEWTLRKSTNSRSPLPFGNRNSGYALVPTQRFCNPCREYDSMWQNMPALVGAKGVSTLTQKTSQVISTTVSYCFHAMFPPLFASAQPCSSFHGQKMQRACISDPVMGSNWSAPRSFCQILPSELPSSASYLKELQLRAGTKIGKKKTDIWTMPRDQTLWIWWLLHCLLLPWQRWKHWYVGLCGCRLASKRLALGSTCWNLETNLSALNHLEQASRKYWSFWFYSTTWSRKSCLHVPVHNNTERRGKGHPASAWRNLMHGGHLWHARYDHALMTRARRELVREHCAQFTVDVLRAIYQACPFIVCFSML